MTRVWGRVTQTDGTRKWQAFETSASGSDDAPNLIWLQNVLLLNLNESPFYANWGIPVQQTLATSVYPDYYMAQTQNRFSQYFASCVITRMNTSAFAYNVAVVTKTGVTINQTYTQAGAA